MNLLFVIIQMLYVARKFKYTVVNVCKFSCIKSIESMPGSFYGIMVFGGPA